MPDSRDPFRAETEDAFPPGPNVRAYVPSSTSEQGLAYLAAKLREAPTLVGISGGPGTGRSMLLHLLLARLGHEFEAVLVPTGRFSASELAAWIAAHTRGSSHRALPLLIGVDDAERLDAGALRWLRARVETEEARAVLVLSTEEERVADRIRWALDTRIFTEPLALMDAQRHIETRLAITRTTIPIATVERIALVSQGNPRSIHRLADAVVFAHWARQRTQSEPRTSGERGAARAPRVARRTAPRAGVTGFWISLRRVVGRFARAAIGSVRSRVRRRTAHESSTAPAHPLEPR